MSRALDADVIAVLKHGDHDLAYQDISTALCFDHALDGLLEIEILSRGQFLALGLKQNLIRDGNALAISKPGLVQAFFVARRVVLSAVFATEPLGADEIRAATAVVLLMDPEHLTAANLRKRVLVRTLDSNADYYLALQMLYMEIQFVDSLLTSPLHRHTKSPTLWNHRRWIVSEQLRRASPTNGLFVDDIQSTLKHVVMVAGERHPQNYYAWCHARWLVGQVLRRSIREAGVAVPSQALEAIAKDVKLWSYRHHTDISGWSFLTFMLGVCDTNSGSLIRSTIREVSGLAQDMRWNGESVTWFINMLAKMEGVGPVRAKGDDRCRCNNATEVDNGVN